MKLMAMMSKKRTSLYLFPAAILCLHLIFAASGLFLASAFQVELDARSVELLEARMRLREINESELNKDYILEVMSSNVEDYEIFVQLFRTLAAVGGVVSCLSIAALIQIYKYQADAR